MDSQSFDTYAAAEGAPPPAEDFKEFGPPFSVGPRWALDSFFYNELMAEVDYVCAEEVWSLYIHIRLGSQRRKKKEKKKKST